MKCHRAAGAWRPAFRRVTMQDISTESMDIKIQKESGVSVHDQLVAQIVFLTATRRLKPGEALPSVRALARQLGIHHNTISEAYQDLVNGNFIVRRRGSRMVVQTPEPSPAHTPSSLDTLISETLRMAHQRGYTTQQLADGIRARLPAEPPQDVLALTPDAGMRRLFEVELRAVLHFPVRSCSPEEVVLNPALATAAVVASPPAFLPAVLAVLPKTQPVVPIVFSSAAVLLNMIRELAQPSLILVVSVSERFLEIARGVLSPVSGPRHSLVEHLLGGQDAPAADAADFLICDVIAVARLRGPARRKAVVYRLISPECLVQIASAIGCNAEPPGFVAP